MNTRMTTRRMTTSTMMATLSEPIASSPSGIWFVFEDSVLVLENSYLWSLP